MADMQSYAKNCKSTILSSLGYRNALGMIDWLCNTIGFEKKAVYTTPEGGVMHSELTFGNGMIMIGSVSDRGPAWFKHPDEVGGVETRSLYLIVTDCDAIYAKAKAAGARILSELEEKSYGGKGFTCADPEGHIWSFGTYDPWETTQSAA